MPGKKSNIKDKEQYEALRDKGMSKEKAARIANAGKSASRRGGKAEVYEDWTKEELLDKAREIGLKDYSDMNKSELINALRNY